MIAAVAHGQAAMSHKDTRALIGAQRARAPRGPSAPGVATCCADLVSPAPIARAPRPPPRRADSLDHLALALAKLSECHATLFADGGRRDVVLARRLRPFLQAGIGELQDMHLGCLYYSPR